jgi:hypothetical protein
VMPVQFVDQLEEHASAEAMNLLHQPLPPNTADRLRASLMFYRLVSSRLLEPCPAAANRGAFSFWRTAHQAALVPLSRTATRASNHASTSASIQAIRRSLTGTGCGNSRAFTLRRK